MYFINEYDLLILLYFFKFFKKNTQSFKPSTLNSRFLWLFTAIARGEISNETILLATLPPCNCVYSYHIGELLCECVDMLNPVNLHVGRYMYRNPSKLQIRTLLAFWKIKYLFFSNRPSPLYRVNRLLCMICYLPASCLRYCIITRAYECATTFYFAN